MRAIIQRVSQAQVTINKQIVGSISKGLLLYLGINNTDSREDIKQLSNKILNLRIFPDSQNKMNVSGIKKIDLRFSCVELFIVK